MKQALLIATSALLFVQIIHALPHMKRESVAVVVHGANSLHETQGTAAEEDDAKVQLVADTLTEIAVLAKWTLDKGSVVIRNSVKELNAIPVKDEQLQANITRMSKVVEEISRINMEEQEEVLLKLFTEMIEFATLLADYQGMPECSKLQITLKAALENNGFNKFDSEFKEKIVGVAKNFETRFSEFSEGMTTAKKAKNAKLIHWYEEFKAETGVEAKLDKFGEFFYLIS
ncbi:uncharacterized protein LOC118738474 [Rhagoletis pomonella]|uniref:uncharacterized protein LOC118738474 n=1 Tax=Rhagoletis pomonella TaxID=28610 RepID=UPI0017801B55|nr:uncharacterized protein LOC118738474 [Rhagoletis pomonella]